MRFPVAVLSATMLFTLSACSSDSLPEPGAQSSSESTSQEPSLDDATWAATYRSILANPGEYPVNPAARYTPTGEYSYALVEANGGGNPELLLAVEGTEFNPVIVFTTDGAEDGTATASTENLIFGVASAGGARSRLESSAAGTGVYQVDSRSTSPTATSQKYTLDGTGLAKSGPSEDFDNMTILPDHQVIKWTPSTDISALRAGLAGSIAPEGFIAGGRNGTDLVDLSEFEGGPSDKPSASGDTVTLNGVIRAWSTEEALQGQPAPNPEDPNNVYYVIIFDKPVEITGMKAGSDYTQVNDFGVVGKKERQRDDSAEWEPYVGKRVTLTVPTKTFMYPSDTSLPLGGLMLKPSKVEVK